MARTSQAMLAVVVATLAATLAVLADGSALPALPAEAVATADVAAAASQLKATVHEEDSDDDDDDDDDDTEEDSDDDDNNDDDDNDDDGDDDDDDSGSGDEDSPDFAPRFNARRQGKCVQFTRCGSTQASTWVKDAVPYNCFKKEEDDADDCSKTAINFVEGGELKKWYKCTCYTGGKATASVPKMCRQTVNCSYNEGDDDDDDESDD